MIAQCSQLANLDATNRTDKIRAIRGTRAKRYELCAIYQFVFNRRFERAEAQDFAAPIARGRFSFTPVLEVTSPGIARSRRQWAGL